MNKIPVIIDSDPGHDDVVAIMLAMASGKFDIKGITTVPGNGPLDAVTDNMLKVFDHLGVTDIPVVRGIAKPFKGPCHHPVRVHGYTGLDGPLFPLAKQKALNVNVCDFYRDVITSSPEKVTIIALGPLTNVAAALLAEPEIKDNIERIALMGGSAAGGNATPTAEFNFWHDAEAAAIVFKSGIPILMCGLDVTLKAHLTLDEIEQLRGIGTRGSQLMVDMFDYYKMYRKADGFLNVLPHDAVPVAWLIDPSVVYTKPYLVEIDICGEYTKGCSVTHVAGFKARDKKKYPPNADVAYDCDRKRFVGMIFDAARHFN